MATKTIDQLTALGAQPDDSDNLVIDDSGVTKKVTAGQLKSDCLRSEKNNALSTSVGTRIGTLASQLLGFWNATPVDQPALTADLLDSLQEVGLIASGAGDTPLNLSSGALTCGAATAGATGVASLASTGAVTAASVAATGAVTSNGTAGIGYATGAGATGTVSGTGTGQTVTINKTCGSITCASAAGSTAVKTVTVTNSTVTATDVVIVCGAGGANPYETAVYKISANAFTFNYLSPSGTTTEAPVFNFAVIKAVTA